MPLTPPSNRHDTAAQTPTPSNSFQYGGHPLTSIKPFTTSGPHTLSQRKPHPLAQVSMMNSAETEDEDDLDLGLSRTLDLGLSKRGRGSRARVSLDGTATDEDGTLDEQLAALDRQGGYGSDPDGREYDSALSEDDSGGSLRIALSSPGVGRFGIGARLSDVRERELDTSFPANANDFSRDLSALDIPISPERRFEGKRPGAPTPDHASRRDENFNISSTPASGFDGMARQLRKDFERITGVASPSRSNQHRTVSGPTSPSRKRQTSNGTLKGQVPAADTRAKRVFGTDLGNNRAPGASSAALRTHEEKLAPKLKRPTIAGLAEALHRNAPAHTRKTAPKSQPPRVVVDVEEDDEPTPRAPQRHYTSAAARTAAPAPATPEILRAGALPTSAGGFVGGDISAIGVPDVTGLTEGLRSPDKVGIPATKRTRPSRVSSEPDVALTHALHELRARLDSLEAENENSDHKVRHLQNRLLRGRGERGHVQIEVPQGAPFERQDARSVKGNIARLSALLATHSHAITSLKAFQGAADELFDDVDALKGDVNTWKGQVDVIRGGLEQVADEVVEVRGLVEGLLQGQEVGALPQRKQPAGDHARRHQPRTSRKARLDRAQDVQDWQRGVRSVSEGSEQSATSFIGPDEIERLRADIADEGVRRAAHGKHKLHRARSQPLHAQPRAVPDELKRAEAILRSVPKGGHDVVRCSECKRRKKLNETRADLGVGVGVGVGASGPAVPRADGQTLSKTAEERKERREQEQSQGVPPQTVLARVLSELEDDFAHQRALFIELSEEYKKMDPATSHVGKRKILADHLRESVDLLEQKADHIKRLYDLLHFRDARAGDPAWEAARAAGVCV